MPDIPVTFGSSLVGRLSCTPEFASMLTDANTQGCRFELSGGYEKRHEENARLVELVVSPLPLRTALTDEERQAIADAVDVFAESAIHIDNEADRRRAETLRGLLRRLS